MRSGGSNGVIITFAWYFLLPDHGDYSGINGSKIIQCFENDYGWLD
jgi:hypothetical protein